MSPAGSESSSASRLSSPPISVDGQAQRPRNAAAAAEQSTAAFGGTLDVNPEVDWCDKPLLACGPTAAAADSHIDSGSTSGAGEWRQAGPSASQQGHPAVDAARPDRFEHSSTASAKAVALPHLGTDQGWMQASSLHPTPPLAQDMGDSSVTPSVQPSTDIGQSRTSLAGASLTSKASTSSRSSQQDGSTVLHTASMSSGSFYTHADSTVSKACSSPHHNGASTGLDQHRSCLQAPQRDAGAATSKGRGVHPTSEQQGDTTSQTALLACQVCAVAHSHVDPMYTQLQVHVSVSVKCTVMARREGCTHRTQMLTELSHVDKAFQPSKGSVKSSSIMQAS